MRNRGRTTPSKMQQELENESPSMLQRVLRKYENNKNLLVISCDSVMGTRMGDNYMSVVKRVKVLGHINGIDGEYIFFLCAKKVRNSKWWRNFFVNKEPLTYGVLRSVHYSVTYLVVYQTH